MNIIFESMPEYRLMHSHFYDAILELLKDPDAKINVNSVTKKAGYSRSSIRKDRDQWKSLFIDIDIANKKQQSNPSNLLKSSISKNKSIKTISQDYQKKYMNVLSALYDLSKIVEEQRETIEQLKLDNKEYSDTVSTLKNEIYKIKSNGKVIPITTLKN